MFDYKLKKMILMIKYFKVLMQISDGFSHNELKSFGDWQEKSWKLMSEIRIDVFGEYIIIESSILL